MKNRWFLFCCLCIFLFQGHAQGLVRVADFGYDEELGRFYIVIDNFIPRSLFRIYPYSDAEVREWPLSALNLWSATHLIYRAKDKEGKIVETSSPICFINYPQNSIYVFPISSHGRAPEYRTAFLCGGPDRFPEEIHSLEMDLHFKLFGFLGVNVNVPYNSETYEEDILCQEQVLTKTVLLDENKTKGSLALRYMELPTYHLPALYLIGWNIRYPYI